MQVLSCSNACSGLQISTLSHALHKPKGTLRNRAGLCSPRESNVPAANGRGEVRQGVRAEMPRGSAAARAGAAAFAAAISLALAVNPVLAESALAEVSVPSIEELLPNGESPELMMKGMSTKNFDPRRYAGRWFEVASLKRGFSGQGQDDCHCTQGLYAFDDEKRAIEVETLCVHGSPDGYITGIRGRVTCVPEEDPSLRKGPFEERCFLKFPTIPFVPRQPYDVLATDYDTYALVSGSKGTSFIQIYSRTPNPGAEFIAEKKAMLTSLGYPADDLKDTPQDCSEEEESALGDLLTSKEMMGAMDNRLPMSGRQLKLGSRGLEAPPLGLGRVLEYLKDLGKLFGGR